MSSTDPTAALTTFDLDRYHNPFVAGRVEQIERLLPSCGGGRILELGCGPGFFTRLLRSRGWRVTVVDLQPAHLTLAAPAAEDVLCGDVLATAATLPSARFEAVVALEIIEHLTEDAGAELLRHAYRVLAPGGWLMLSTPNRWSPEGLAGHYIGDRLLRRGRWQAWDPSHQHVYSSLEILRLVRRSGFAIEGVRGFWYSMDVPRLGRVGRSHVSAGRFPWNRFGFNIALRARRLAGDQPATGATASTQPSSDS